ncbi:MAG: hypothetical protein V1706_04495 [Pseudomonadota bacterium]
MNEKVDIEEIIDRLKKKTSLSTNKDIADLLGLSPTDYCNRKKRGTLLPLLIDWAMNEKVDLQYFIVEDKYQNEATGHGQIGNDPEVAELLEGARRVLKSDNPLAFDALERATSVILTTPWPRKNAWRRWRRSLKQCLIN